MNFPTYASIYFSSLLSTACIHCFVFLELLSAANSILQAPIDLDLTMIRNLNRAAYTLLQNYLCVWSTEEVADCQRDT